MPGDHPHLHHRGCVLLGCKERKARVCDASTIVGCSEAPASSQPNIRSSCQAACGPSSSIILYFWQEFSLAVAWPSPFGGHLYWR